MLSRETGSSLPSSPPPSAFARRVRASRAIPTARWRCLGVEARSAVEDVRAHPPAAYGDFAVTAVEQPADDVLVHRLSGGRVVVRPSGTEPKLKAYLEVVVPVAGPGALPAARDRAGDELARLRAEMSAALGL